MSEQDLVGGKVNLAKYMALLESESDLKVKLQQLFLKKKKDEAALNAEIERLTALLKSQQEQVPSEPTVSTQDYDALKSEMEALRNRFNIINSKLSQCRTAYDALEEINNENVAQLEKQTSELEAARTISEPTVSTQDYDALKSEMEALQNRFNIVNSKLSQCRTAYHVLEETNSENAAQLEKQTSELEAARTILEKHLPNHEQFDKSSGSLVTEEVATDKPQSGSPAEYPHDDLTQIKGIGPKFNSVLNENGVTSFAQIADWKAADIKKIDQELSFKGRIKRDEWVKQAKKLMKS